MGGKKEKSDIRGVNNRIPGIKKERERKKLAGATQRRRRMRGEESSGG